MGFPFSARLKEDHRAGFRMQRIRVGRLSGKLFEVGGWYGVSADDATELAHYGADGARSDEPLPLEKRAFEIADPAERERAIRAAELVQAGAPVPEALLVPPDRDSPSEVAAPAATDEPAAPSPGAPRPEPRRVPREARK